MKRVFRDNVPICSWFRVVILAFARSFFAFCAIVTLNQRPGGLVAEILAGRVFSEENGEGRASRVR